MLVVPTPKLDKSFEKYKSLRGSLYTPTHTHTLTCTYTDIHRCTHKAIQLDFLKFKKENRIALKSVK